MIYISKLQSHDLDLGQAPTECDNGKTGVKAQTLP